MIPMKTNPFQQPNFPNAEKTKPLKKASIKENHGPFMNI